MNQSAITGFIPVIVIAIIFGAYLGLSPVATSTTIPPTRVSATTPNCSAPCAVWIKSSGSNPEPLAISHYDSFVAVGNGQILQIFDAQGNELWSYDTNHTISSISISSNDQYVAVGGWQTKGGCSPNLHISGPHSCPAEIYTNGAVFLFDASNGRLLWSVGTGSGNPVWKIKLSSDGSKLAVETADGIMYMDDAGNTIWTKNTSSLGMDMSSDGNLVVASTGNAITAFNGEGQVLWTRATEGSGISVNDISISSNATLVWAGSAVSGYNGTLYLLNRQGELLWNRQIYSPALSIQTGDNMTAFVNTNWGALLYGADGSLLRNITTSAVTGTPSGCSPHPNFWYWSGGLSPVAFIDSEGNVVSSYNLYGYTNNAVLSADGQYALVASNNEGSGFSLAFVFLGNSNYQNCPHS